MEKQDIEHCEKFLEMVGKFHIPDKTPFEKIPDMMVILKNFSTAIKNQKDTKLEPVKRKKSINKIKEDSDAKS